MYIYNALITSLFSLITSLSINVVFFMMAKTSLSFNGIEVKFKVFQISVILIGHPHVIEEEHLIRVINYKF